MANTPILGQTTDYGDYITWPSQESQKANMETLYAIQKH